MKKSIPTIITLLIVLSLLFSSCTQEELKQLEGIVQNIDNAKGEITIVTNDGQTVTLKFDTETSVETGGAPSSLGTLEVGAPVQVDVDEGNKTIRHIEASQTRPDGEDDKGTEGNTDISDDTDSSEEETDTGEDVSTAKDTTETGVDEGNTEDADVEKLIEEMEAERERLAEEIRKRTAAGEVDEEWVREVEAERTRLAEEIQRLREGGASIDPPDTNAPDDPVDEQTVTSISGTIQEINGNLWTIISNGKPIVIDVSKLDIGSTPAVGSTVTVNGVQSGGTVVAESAEIDTEDGGTHPEDGGDHPDDGDDHPDDGGDHPDDGDDHPDV